MNEGIPMGTQCRPQVAVQDAMADSKLAIFSTCPPSNGSDNGAEYFKQVAEIARWSETAGCTGILVYSDNSMVDPWQVAQIILENTRFLAPLVAVQPIYMHPYMLAKKVASLGYLYGRKVWLNMVAGGFKNDLIALDDQTPHDKRYARLTEYTTIVTRLLRGDTVSFEGEFYRVQNLKLAPALPEYLQPGVFMSGSSEAGIAAANAVGATAIHYPKPASDYDDTASGTDAGIRIGVVCREGEQEAWDIARARFPEDRRGQLTHQMAMKVSDSVWHKQLSELAASAVSESNPYWLVPFENYKTMCPYLVGDYQRVGTELKRYVDLGYHTFILDVPGSMDELVHTRRAFDQIGEVA
jgi:alkanesulfonate monooxygenase